MRVLSTVSVIVDLPLTMPQLPERGGDVLGAAGARTPGGGFNIVAAAVRQGAPTVLASPLGDGENGELCRRALARLGIEHLGPFRQGADTGLCVTITEPDGERTFLTAPGAEAIVSPSELARIDVLRDDIIIVSGYDLCYPQAGEAISCWVTSLGPGPQVIVDPGPLIADIPADRWAATLGRVDLLTLNQREAELASGLQLPKATDLAAIEAVIAGLRDLLGPDGAVVLRLGAAGAVVADSRGNRRIPAPAVEIVDSTGAGDAHTGALGAALCDGQPLDAAVRRANAAGALTVTRRGPATSPTRAETENLLAGSW